MSFLKKNLRGFTLVEILVGMTVFLIVIGAVLGLFVLGIQQQRRSLATQVLLNQTSYALEFMSRSLRMANKELSAPTCLSQNGLNYEIPLGYQIGGPNLGTGIKFINVLETDVNYKCQEFYLDSGSKQLYYKRGGDPALPLTSNKLEITSLKFNLIGQDQPPTDNLQPRVTISMEIKSTGITQGPPVLKIQTTISQRNLDVQY